MDKKSMTLAMGMLLLAAGIPAAAYHITGIATTGTPAGTSAAEWTNPGSVLIICESDGPTDPRNANPASNSGVGGLCTTGQNAVTGAAANTSAPAKGLYVKIDACGDDQATRAANGLACSSTNIGFIGEVGAFGCDVATDDALYYDALYAWWSYDGDGNYTSAAEESGHHGHVSMFVNATSTDTLGTAVTSLADPTIDILNCGSSPAFMDPLTNAMPGPVVRANE